MCLPDGRRIYTVYIDYTVQSILLHSGFGPNNHREDVLHFICINIFFIYQNSFRCIF